MAGVFGWSPSEILELDDLDLDFWHERLNEYLEMKNDHGSR